MNKKLVLVTCPRVEENSSDFKSFFNQNNIESLFSYPTNQQFDKNEMKKLLKKVDLAIVGDDDLSRGAISDLSKLKYIIKWGSGVDNIDLDFAGRTILKYLIVQIFWVSMLQNMDLGCY